VNVALRFFCAGVAAVMVGREATMGLGIAVAAFVFWAEGLAGACFGGCEHEEE